MESALQFFYQFWHKMCDKENQQVTLQTPNILQFKTNSETSNSVFYLKYNNFYF